jgi:hypothetical protein
MATVTQATPTHNLVESNRRVRHPLERLRGYIRTYVSLEGAAVLVLYLALWFWVGLLFDFGVFKAFGLDWVQALNWWVRAGLLGALVAGLVVTVGLAVLTRLFREFRDSALALVLERRFPEVLGDRLITAVELSDPRQAAALGYSAAMVEQTIHEAAVRVETVPVKEVFNWRRLVVRSITLAVLTLVLYLLVGGGFCLVNGLRAPGTASAGFSDFHEVSTIWAERNLFMMNTIWPRKAHLELIGWPESGELRMGKGEQPPSIRVRALKYVVAGAPSSEAVQAYHSWLEQQHPTEDIQALVGTFSKQPPEGWRPLSWFDLTPSLLGQERPSVPMPTEWEPRDLSDGLTIDEIELRLDREETHNSLSPDAQEGLRSVIALVKERAAHPKMRRILRELEIPETATLIYRGNTTSSQSTLQKVADNEYTGQFGDLREDVTFYVQGLDYYTPNRYVKVVDPPALETLVRQEERPAYLYYRVGRDVKAEDLRGKKQRFAEYVVSLQGGEVIRIDVPTGTNLSLTATATKDLQSVKMEPHKPGTRLEGTEPEMENARTFRTRFTDVRQEQRFYFKFVDTDGVRGQRQVLILPTEDAPPKIREFAPDEIIRKVRAGFMVSVSARIPFLGKVDDDYGLSGVHYAYTLNRLESGVRFNLPEVLALGTMPLMSPQGQGLLPGMTYLAGALDVAARQKQEATTKASQVAERFALPRFDRMLEDQSGEVLPLERVQPLLAQPQQEPYRRLVRTLDIKPDAWRDAEVDPVSCDFPLWKKSLKTTDPARAQPRYQMELWLEVTDTDLDNEPDRQGVSRPHLKVGDEKFVFIIVSENELLAEIAKDEEKLSGDMEGTYGKLLEGQEKLVQVTVDLSSPRVKADELGPMSVRAEQVGEVLEKSQASVRDIAATYARILRELQTNQVNSKMIARVESTLVKPLADVDGTFDTTRESVAAFRTALDSTAELAARVKDSRDAGAKAKADLQELMLRLQNIMAAMQKMTDINKLVKMVVEIENQEKEQAELLEKIRKAVVEKEINELLNKDKKSDASEPEKKKP